MTMLVLAPTQVIASAADNEKKYISEVKVGMGEDSETASKALLDEGYTILKDDNGDYADLTKNKIPSAGNNYRRIINCQGRFFCSIQR